MRKQFEASREDGRSDRRIVIDRVRGADPGTTFTFEALTLALQEGTGRLISRAAVGAAVRGTNVWLLKEEKRILHSVKGVGYRMALASEHSGLALVRKRSADRQLEWGVRTLRDVRWDELDANSRAAHEGQLMILSGLYQAVHALNIRQTRLESLVGKTLAPGTA